MEGIKKPWQLLIKPSNPDLIEESKNKACHKALTLLLHLVDFIGCEESFNLKELKLEDQESKGNCFIGFTEKDIEFLLGKGFLDQESKGLYKVNSSGIKYLEQNDALGE
ncbi:MAG: hypothetical protein Q8N22_00235 [bacterium]|nr:hypothetical protein [bacterium]